MILDDIYLILTGLIAGAIDSIAGGGGMITLPVLSSVVGPGAHAIGTNKIVGASGAFIAFLVYANHLKKSKQPFPLKKGLLFLVTIGLGSFIGSLCTPHLPKIYFRYLLIAVCPLVLWVLWNKQMFLQRCTDHPPRPFSILIATGLGVGFYDGFFGPGGGTFMLLGLLWAVRLPLFEAHLLSKLANTISASVSLVSYAAQGYVHVYVGVMIAVGMIVGGFFGAKAASQRAEKVVRPVLAFVVVLLLLNQLREVILAS